MPSRGNTHLVFGVTRALCDPAEMETPRRRPNRLRELRGKKFSQQQVADAIGVTQQHYQRMEAGMQRLNTDHLFKLGAFFGIDWQEVIAKVSLQRVPVLDEIQAGAFAEAKADVQRHDFSNVDRWVVVDYPKPTVIALQVRGDSMDNIITEGGTVFVDYSVNHLEDGELGVFRLPDGRATLKRFRRDETGEWLEPDSSNRRHAPIVAGNEQEIGIVGRVFALQLPQRTPDHNDQSEDS